MRNNKPTLQLKVYEDDVLGCLSTQQTEKTRRSKQGERVVISSRKLVPEKSGVSDCNTIGDSLNGPAGAKAGNNFSWYIIDGGNLQNPAADYIDNVCIKASVGFKVFPRRSYAL